MWTEITRPKYERKCLGYSSNLSDAEWATIEPLLPQRNRLGRPPKTEMRSIVNAMFYIVRTGCQWRQLPREFPPFTTVQHYFYAWREEVYLHAYATVAEAKAGIGAWLSFYNEERQHQSLGYRTPWQIYQEGLWICGRSVLPTGCAFPTSRANSESGEMLAFAHIPTLRHQQWI
jgi:transposase